MRAGREPDPGDGAAGAPDAGSEQPGGERRSDPLVVAQTDALVLFAHLVTSAELCLSEPWDYGSYRLLDAASRLATAMLARSTDEGRAFLEAFLADVEASHSWSARDRERNLAFLREASRRTAEHLAQRPVVPAPSMLPVAPGLPGPGTDEPAGTPPAPSAPVAERGPGEAPVPDQPPSVADAVLQTIRTRRVTRAFAADPVSDQALGLVLEAARWATSGGGRRIHPLLVVRSPTTIGRLRAVTPGMFSSPPVVIVVCTDAAEAAGALIQLEHDRTTWIDVGTLAMNMMVAAHALGLGSCPVTSFSHPAVSVVLDLPPTIEPELFVLLGHPAGPGPGGRPSRPARHGLAGLPAGFAWWERAGQTAQEAG